MKSLLLSFLLTLGMQVSAQFSLNTTFANLSDCDTMTRGIYVVWWDKDFNFGAQVDVLLDSMISCWDICLNEMAMVDPPNPLWQETVAQQALPRGPKLKSRLPIVR